MVLASNCVLEKPNLLEYRIKILHIMPYRTYFWGSRVILIPNTYRTVRYCIYFAHHTSDHTSTLHFTSSWLLVAHHDTHNPQPTFHNPRPHKEQLNHGSCCNMHVRAWCKHLHQPSLSFTCEMPRASKCSKKEIDESSSQTTSSGFSRRSQLPF